MKNFGKLSDLLLQLTITFRTEKLLQDDWYNAIQSVDVVILPYTAERYLYNRSAIYFTAIGAYKPVLVTRILNPEVMAQDLIGEFIDPNNYEKVKRQLVDFVNFMKKEKKDIKKHWFMQMKCIVRRVL